ncbi:MAG: hypothetical protein RIT81_18135 [Deltaproteobacteria bacterium]
MLRALSRMQTTERDIPSASWAALLEHLGASARVQAEAYERLRSRLEAFFRYRGWSDPDELVDATFDRVGAKLAAGTELTSDVPRYALGVARFVHLEQTKARAQQDRALRAAQEPTDEAAERIEHERRLAALEGCLNALSDADRRALARYHADRGQSKIDARRALAEKIGVTLNALRLRMFRLRNNLEQCVRAKLAQKQDGAERHSSTGSPPE